MSETPDIRHERPLGIAGRLTQYFIASPLTPLFLLAAFVVGLLALAVLPREEEPQISVPMVDLIVQADGLKAEDAAKLVTEPLETILRGISGVEHVYSRTLDDRALVTARFLTGTDEDEAILRVHEKVRANLDRIPVGIPEPLIVGRGINDVAVATVTLYPAAGAGAVSAADLTRIAREVQIEVSKIDDVGLSYVTGAVETRLRIAPRLDRLALYGVTLQELAGKVEAANRSFPAGSLLSQGKAVEMVAGGTLSAPEEIGALPLVTRDGRTVYLRDLADIGFTDAPDSALVSALVEGEGGAERRPAVTLAFAKRAGANAVTVTEAVFDRIEALRGEVIPGSVELRVTRDYGHTALEKSNELLFHLGLATLSIVGLILIAIGWREAMVVAVVIPVTILLTLFAAQIMGYTLNRVSLFALIFAIGILVDDAIVVIENITRHWAMNDARSRPQAAIEAVAEVGNPTIVATLTVVAALLPMLFVSGLMGPYMSPIPANASAAMIFSFFVAVMVTPWLMVKIAGRGHGHHHEEGAGGRIGHVYRRLAGPLLKSRARAWAFLLATLVLTIGSLGLFWTKAVTVKLLPFDNKSELSVVIDLPEGAALEATDQAAQMAALAALEIPEVTAAEVYAGTAAPFDFNGLVRHYFQRQSPELGEVHLGLLPKGERSRESHEIALDLRARLGGLSLPDGASVKVVETPPGPPVLSTLLAEIYGPDPGTRRAVAAKVEEIFRSVPFIVDVDNSYGVPATRIRAVLSGDDMEYYRVQESDVFDTLALLNQSKVIGYSHRGEGRAPVPIVLERPRAEHVPGAAMLGVPVPANALPGGRGVVELGDVARLQEETASFPIYRRNARAAEMVTAELAGQYEAPLYGMLAVQEAIDAADWGSLPKPVISLHGQPQDERAATLLWDGEWDVTWITFRDMGAAFAVALLGIYVLVVAQFRSFRLPLVILTPVPLTLVGILAGHWIFGAPFTATSMIGFIALAGIIVRNSILLADFIGSARSPGRPLREVVLEAGSVRARPILLTALAAMIGAAVILADPIFQGLAISLLFGLASSTLLTLLAIPAVYVALKGAD
ncbi:efflux RND transporter permease subunit [Mangrovicoccus sp. HB161399]|uniref:efflux RND transporter permease subunit n=1 Tax=Mangrovicoccus sp. HB161399 TaxID=2720392 RepID=UPI001558029C|nr:efflux RND transporter permease subunit [Mangrovicoccus sp. HB161399]